MRESRGYSELPHLRKPVLRKRGSFANDQYVRLIDLPNTSYKIRYSLTLSRCHSINKFDIPRRISDLTILCSRPIVPIGRIERTGSALQRIDCRLEDKDDLQFTLCWQSPVCTL